MAEALGRFDPRATYDEASVEYEHASRDFWQYLSVRTVERLGLQPGERVLDAPCGTGPSLIVAALSVGSTGRVVGVDVAPRMLAIAREKVRAAGLSNVDVQLGDMTAISAPEVPYDAVICVLGVFFVDDMPALVRSFVDLVRPDGGRVAVTVFGERFVDPLRNVFVRAVHEVAPGLDVVQPWRRTADVAALRRLFEGAGAGALAIDTEDDLAALPTADVWWGVVMGSGLRRTVTSLGPELAAAVRARCDAYIEAEGTDHVVTRSRYAVFERDCRTGDGRGSAHVRPGRATIVAMADSLLFVSRILKLPLLDGDGDNIGRIVDLVLGPPVRGAGPTLLGLVAGVSRRRIFVAATRVAEITASGARLRTQAVDLKPFRPRAAELLATTLLDRAVGGEIVVDIGLADTAGATRTWSVAAVALGKAGALRRAKPLRVVPWGEVAELFDTGDVGREAEALRALHPSDRARAVTKLTPDRRSELAAALADEDLADMLEELPEAEQVSIITALATARAAHVLEEMEPDDAADLLAELTREHQSRLLEAMLPEEADPLRRLLTFDDHSAGGLMTPEPLVLTPEATVAEALARVRAEDVPAAIATSVFVVQPPTQTPTGTYLGMVTVPRLLREPPGELLGRVADGTPEPIAPDLGEIEVAARLAAYDLLAMPVCDAEGRLLGAVTVDDVLDRTLPAGWRSR